MLVIVEESSSNIIKKPEIFVIREQPIFNIESTLSWRRSLSYRNQSIDLLWKLMDWFLYDRDLRHERVKRNFS